MKEAMDSYHNVESRVYNWMCNCGLARTEWLLAFRAIVQKPLEYFLKNETELFCEHDPKYGLKLKEGGEGNLVYGEGDVYISYFNVGLCHTHCLLTVANTYCPYDRLT